MSPAPGQPGEPGPEREPALPGQPDGPGGPGAGPATAPGMPGDAITISDPQVMRALAHPARLAILQHLAIDGPATATECAEVAGLSPSACSYHLRALARHGFVEEDPASAADGRHRPWRARIISFSLEERPGQPIAVRAATQLLKQSVQALIEDVRAEYADRMDSYSEQWTAAAGVHQDVAHVTPDELTELREEIAGVIGRYRRLGRAERGPGTRRVLAVMEFLPWFDPDGGS